MSESPPDSPSSSSSSYAQDIEDNRTLNNLQLEFSLEQIVSDDSKKILYCVLFCDVLPGYHNYFASCGGNSVKVYRILEDNTVEFIYGFLDEDAEECFCCLAWCATSEGTPLLMVAGLRGIIKGINCVTLQLDCIFVGIGHDVNELRTHSVDDGLLFSASKDESIRLWNVRTCVCVVIFGGEKGHRDQVCTVDVHPLGNLITSGGMDTSLKMWNLEEPHVRSAISRSYSEPRRPGNQAFQTYTEQLPLFSSTDVHSGYVDSVLVVGNCMLSKSTNNRISLWSPDSNRYKGAVLHLQEYSVLNCGIWYMRLGLSVPLNVFALGNMKGNVSIYSLLDARGKKDLPDRDDLRGPSVILTHAKCRSPVRSVSFSPSGGHLIYSCEDGTIPVWSIKSTAAS